MDTTRSAFFPERRRPITSCTECYRRKQKCNRGRPCGNCSARGATDKCQYEDSHRNRSSGAIQSSHHHQGLESAVKSELYGSSPLSASSDLLGRIGYSLASRRTEFYSAGIKFFDDDSEAHLPNEEAVDTTGAAECSNLLAHLPSEDVINELFNFYFSDDNWSFPILDENYTRNLYEAWKVQHKSLLTQMPLELLMFPALLFAVLAVALQFLPLHLPLAHTLKINTVTDCDRLSQLLSRVGQQVYELLRPQQASMTAVEYNLSCTMWLKNCGRGKEAWQYLGVAIRLAQEIDLHQIDDGTTQSFETNVSDTLLHLWDIEHRKRLWARLFIMDSHMAMALGRPRAIHRQDCTTGQPVDCEYPKEPSRTVPVSVKHDRQAPSDFSPTMFWIAISHKIHDMLSIRAGKHDNKEYDRVQSISNEAYSLLCELPPALRPYFPDTTWDQHKPYLPSMRLRIATTANIFLLALHRPYISVYKTSREVATEAAFQILQLQRQLFSRLNEPQHKLYGHSFYTVDAGIFLASMTLRDSVPDFGLLGRVNVELRSAFERLALMKERNPTAAMGELLLRKCCQAISAKLVMPLNTGKQERSGILPSSQGLDVESNAFLQDFVARTPFEPALQLASDLSSSGPPAKQQKTTHTFSDITLDQDDDFSAFLVSD